MKIVQNSVLYYMKSGFVSCFQKYKFLVENLLRQVKKKTLIFHGHEILSIFFQTHWVFESGVFLVDYIFILLQLLNLLHFQRTLSNIPILIFLLYSFFNVHKVFVIVYLSSNFMTAYLPIGSYLFYSMFNPTKY